MKFFPISLNGISLLFSKRLFEILSSLFFKIRCEYLNDFLFQAIAAKKVDCVVKRPSFDPLVSVAERGLGRNSRDCRVYVV